MERDGSVLQRVLTDVGEPRALAIDRLSPVEPIKRLERLLYDMSYDDPQGRPLLDLEGPQRCLPGGTGCYAALPARTVRLLRDACGRGRARNSLGAGQREPLI